MYSALIPVCNEKKFQCMNELGKVQEEITLYIGRQYGCFRTGLCVNNNHRYLHDGRARQRRTIELSAELCSGPVASGAYRVARSARNGACCVRGGVVGVIPVVANGWSNPIYLSHELSGA